MADTTRTVRSGLPGAPGPSAYQAAVAAGFVGNQAAWLASLVGDDGDPGDDGWSPVLAVVNDGARRVLQVTDWAGGTGAKPATGGYVGPTGLTGTIGSAVDVRGTPGSNGTGSPGADGAVGPGIFTYTVVGQLGTSTGAARVYNDTGRTLTITKVRASVGTPPTGSSVIVDVNKNGTTIFTTQGGRPAIAAAGSTATGTPAVTTLADGDYLTIDIDQVGSGTPGADLTVQVALA